MPAPLTFPVESPDGTLLTVAELDLATLQWTAMDEISVADGKISVPVEALGAYAALEADTGALAPPAPITGEVLGSSPAPTGDFVTAATMTFDPEVVLPTQTSLATVTYTLTEDVASGLPLTLVIQEELTLLDGTVRREAPFRADVVVYKTSAGALLSRFRLQPSLTARTTPIKLGAEDVVVVRYAEESVRGNVLGPEGGSVLGDEGDRLDVAAGSLTQPTAIVITRQTVADLPIAAPAGGTVDGVVELDLGGTVLLAPGRLTLTMETPPSAGEVGLLLQVVDVTGIPRYRAMAELEPSSSGWTSKAFDPADLPWPGVTEGGQYVFVHLAAPHAFVRGTAVQVDGTALVGGIVSSPSVEWIQLTDVQGRYVLPVPVGEVVVDIAHPTNGNAVSRTVTVTAGDERLDLDPQLRVVGPEVVEITPADGAVVPAGIEPTVRFSELVNTSSLAAGIELLLDGVPQAVGFLLQGALVNVIPAVSLIPGRTYELRVGVGIRDLSGYVLAHPVSITFTTVEPQLPTEVDRTKITLYEPDASGFARIVGAPGAVPSEHLVFVENRSRFVTTPSVTAGQDGSFDFSIEAEGGDVLLFHVLIPGANEVFFILAPYVSTDGRSFWSGTDTVTFTSADDVTVTVEEGTFDAPARVTVQPQDVATPPTPIPSDLETVFAFDLDFGGAQAKKPLQIKLPGSVTAADNVFLLTKLVDTLEGSAWMLHDLMWRHDGVLTTEDADVLDPLPLTANPAGEVDTSGVVTGVATGKALQLTSKSHIRPPATYKRYLPGATFPGRYHVENPLQDVGFFAVPLAGSLFTAWTRSWDGIVARVNQAIDSLLEGDAILIPSLLGSDLELEVRELSTHFIVFEGTFTPPSAGGLIELPPDTLADTVAPVPIGGSPLRFFLLHFGAASRSGDLDVGISYSYDASAGELTVQGAPGSAAPGVKVAWLDVDEGSPAASSSVAAGADGSFSFTTPAVPEHRYVVAISAVIGARQGLEIAFSEALDADLPGFEVKDGDQTVRIKTTPVGTTERVRIQSITGWRSDTTYKLRLLPELADAGGANSWTHTFEIEFTTEKGQQLDTAEFANVRDTVRLGSLLFVAANQDGLFVYDASDPANLEPYVYRLVGGEREPLGIPFPGGGAVRGLAVAEAHGLLIVAGGGNAAFGQLKVYDPLALDPEAIAADPDNVELLTAAFKGSTIISDLVGGAGTQLPAGSPEAVDVVTDDLTARWIAGQTPPEEYEITVDPPALPPYTLTVNGTAVPESTVTLVNTDGATETAEAGVDGNFSVSVSVKTGDSLELHRDSGTVRWRAGQRPGSALQVAPFQEAEPFTLTVRGDALAGVPVTLRDLTRGRWNRVETPRSLDPAAIESFEVSLEVYPGDELALVRNLDTLAYVATLGAGVEVADVNSFLNKSESPTLIRSNVLGIYSGANDPELAICDAPIPDFSGGLKDLAVLVDDASSPPLTTVVGLLAFKGIVILDSDPNAPGQITFVSSACTEELGNANVWGLEVLRDYPLDFDGDGTYDETEKRDLALTAHPDVGVVIYDISERRNPTLLGLIPLPSPAVALSVDRENRLLYASAFTEGVYVIDFDLPPSMSLVDENADGIDDRILDQIVLGGSTNRPLEAYPELGIGVVSGASSGASTVVLGKPRLVALGPGQDGGRRVLSRLAPLGVPTGPENPADPSSPLRESSFHLLAQLPGFVGDEVTMDVVSVGPGGAEIDAPGDPAILPGLPTTSLSGADAVVLERLAQNPWEEGFQIFQSREMVTIADPRAAKQYQRTSLEEDVCNSCASSEFLLSNSLELLSGHGVAVRFSDATRTQLRPIYGDTRLDEAELELESVPWDLSPSVRQEPTLNPSYGTGDVAPGTLLHSGEMTMSATDVAIRGRGFGLAFTRTYRSGIVGGGPLGAGWDHNYRRRLRPLPNGDVEFFDGRGRRELFELDTGAGTFKAAFRFVELNRTTQGWVMIDAGRNIARFDLFGRLVSLSDAVKESADTGNEMTFSYDLHSRLISVTDTLDREVGFEYDDDGRLERIVDFTGRVFEYDYDGEGRLTEHRTPAVVTEQSPSAPAPLETSYTYETAVGDLAQRLNERNNLTSVTDPKDQTWLELTFSDADSDRRSEEVTDQTWGGHPLQISYDFNLRETIVTDRRGNSCEYRFNDAGQTLRVEDPIQAVWTLEYDSEGRLTAETLPQSRRTETTYDASADRRGQANVLSVRVIPDSRGTNGSSAELVTTMEYESVTNQPVRIVDPRGAVTSILRGSNGLPERVTEAEGTPEETLSYLMHNDHGQLVRATNPNGNVTVYRYFDSGPSEGYLEQVTVAPGVIDLETRFETDARGNVAALIDPREVRHERDYNALDWMTADRQATTGTSDGQPALSYETSYLYDSNGNLFQVSAPYDDGAQHTQVESSYGVLDELLKVRQELMPGGGWIEETYSYDENFNRTRVTDPEGNVHETAYDVRDLPETMTSGLGSSPLTQPIVETSTYNADREPITWADGLGNVWTSTYDGYGRVMKIQDPLGNYQKTLYNNNHYSTFEKAYNSAGEQLAESDLKYDFLNRQIEARQNLFDGDPLQGNLLIDKYRYDGASNLIEAEDALGRITRFVYDAAERLVETTDARGNRRVLTLDASGNVIGTASHEIVDAFGTTEIVTSSSAFDALNRQVSFTDELGNEVVFEPDARGLVRTVIDAEGNKTLLAYDGLDRLTVETTETLPADITVTHSYDKASRRTGYQDALGHQTTWTYDAVDRVTQVTYPDLKSITFTYDAAHNLTEWVDQRGITVSQTFDAANRLRSRSATPPAELTLYGAAVESYDYDGLNRLTRGESGSVVTTMAYDSLSRLRWETTALGTVSYAYDEVGNATYVGYPSGMELGQEFDVLNRPRLIGPPEVTTESRTVHYAYRGSFLVDQKSFGQSLLVESEYDGAYRLTHQKTTGSAGTVFEESLDWSPRHLKTGVTRPDLGGRNQRLGYDGAGRLLHSAEVDPTAPPPSEAQLVTEEDRYSFAYDSAQNLGSRQVLSRGALDDVQMPPDSSGRNRPGSVVTPAGTTPLEYDGAGNLTKKGEVEYHYDFRNRLVRVTDSGIEVALYAYDVFNRRVSKVLPADGYRKFETVWSGWRELEQYLDDLLWMRFTYGLGLDEVVQIEADQDRNGVIDTKLMPHYDETGNVVALTGSNDEIVGRYLYSPFGWRIEPLADDLPPGIKQVVIEGGKITFEADEGVRLNPDSFELTEVPPPSSSQTAVVKSTPIPLTIEHAVHTGRRANRRVEITPTAAVAVGSTLNLEIQPDGIQDHFLNSLASPYTLALTWPDPASGLIMLADESPPEVDELRLKDGYLEISFSEPPDLVAASQAVQVDAQTTTWMMGEDGYTLRSVATLDDGTHVVRINPGESIDRAGKGIAATFEESIVVTANEDDEEYFEVPDPRDVALVTFVNRFTFHGRPLDEETGLLYFRNRYYDPELGRFTTTDPFGYADGPSQYQFSMYSPLTYADPMGLESVRRLIGFEKDIREGRWVGGYGKKSGYVLWNILTFGFLGRHDTDYDATGGWTGDSGTYWRQTAKNLGRSTVEGSVSLATGGWGARGAITLRGALARGAAGGAASGLATTGAVDIYDRMTGGEGASVGDYISSAGSGALFGAIGGRLNYHITGAPYSAQSLLHRYRNEEFGEVFGTPVEYLDDLASRQAHQVSIQGDGKVLSSTGRLYDTSRASTIVGREGRAIYVMDRAGNIYISNFHARGRFHHSSLVSGGEVAAAGEITIQKGLITYINRWSGHYRPLPKHLRQIRHELIERGADLTKTTIDWSSPP